MNKHENISNQLESAHDKAELDLLKEALRLSCVERFLTAITLYKVQ